MPAHLEVDRGRGGCEAFNPPRRSNVLGNQQEVAAGRLPPRCYPVPSDCSPGSQLKIKLFMGQKINPISLRLNINRNFDSSWFQDSPIKYSQLLHQDLMIRKYIKSLFYCVGIHTGRITFQFFQKKLVINYFFHEALAKNARQKLTFSSAKFKQLLALEKPLQSKYVENYISFVLQDTKEFINLKRNIFSKILLLRSFFLQNQNIFSTKQFLNSTNYYLNLLAITSKSSAAAKSSLRLRRFPALRLRLPEARSGNSLYTLNDMRTKRINFTIDKNLKNIEYVLSKKIQSDTIIIPSKMTSRFQSAQFISEHIRQRLQENVSFRQIFKKLSQELKNDTNIQGIRVVCSGRLGGVEMARVESKKYGQTSLHTFSSKIDYASSEAYTIFGLLGVKVWLCFK